MATAVETGNLLKDAALVVDVCMSVEEGDVVTIICDDEHTEHAAIVRAAKRGDAERAAHLMSEHIRVPQRSLKALSDADLAAVEAGL